MVGTSQKAPRLLRLMAWSGGFFLIATCALPALGGSEGLPACREVWKQRPLTQGWGNPIPGRGDVVIPNGADEIPALQDGPGVWGGPFDIKNAVPPAGGDFRVGLGVEEQACIYDVPLSGRYEIPVFPYGGDGVVELLSGDLLLELE